MYEWWGVTAVSTALAKFAKRCTRLSSAVTWTVNAVHMCDHRSSHMGDLGPLFLDWWEFQLSDPLHSHTYLLSCYL